MISPQLKLDGDSIVHVCYNMEDADAAEKLHKEIVDAIINIVYPKLVAHLERNEFLKAIHTCKTITELKALKIQLIQSDLFADIAAEVDKDERLSDTARTFVLIDVANNVVKGAKSWMNENMRQRAEAISRTPPGGRIIDPNSPLKRPGGTIIT